MVSRLRQFFHLHPGEGGLVLILSLILLGNSLAMQVSYVVSISGFLTEENASEMLLVWVIDMVIIIVLTGLQSLVVDRFNRFNLITGMALSFAVVFLALRLMFAVQVAPGLTYALVYFMAEQQWLFFPLVFWVLANDIVDMAQAKRLFPLVATGGFVGQMLGLGLTLIAPALTTQFELASEELLLVNVLIYLLVGGLITLRLRRTRLRKTTHKHETVRETLTEGWSFIKEVPAFRFLTIAIFAMTLCDTVLEFHFMAVSEQVYTSAEDYQTFYSLYRLGIIVAAAAIQGLLTARIIKRVGLKHAFFILPFTLLSGALWALALPGIGSSVGAMVLLKLARDTVDESSRKSFQALVPEERRGRVSMFMDSYLMAGGTLFAALAVAALLLIAGAAGGIEPYQLYLGLAVIVAGLAIFMVFKMRGVYDSSLFNWRLKRRQRGASVLDRLDF
ncbi:MAG: hypothetical protein JW910_17300 [Anaerolineae bacterium]|nr:hypothetical protein [Anaerolineae bacterium]